jgi:hypothetical protein
MRFTLSIESEVPSNISLIADIAEIVEKEGILFVDPNSISSLLVLLHHGLTTNMHGSKINYVVGSGAENLQEEWYLAAGWLEDCAREIRKRITETK